MSESKKKMQLELLMEKLRHKTHQLNLTESAKAFRMTILERRYGIDAVERAQYHKCLDLLQTNMKVTSLQSMLERLESISRQAGLKFTADGSGRAFFISSDMFYLEVIVEPTGKVQEVHILHEGRSEPQTCNEIACCLNSGNFSKFTTHLQGLCAIYQISADKKLKAKAFQALSALEIDLSSMSQLPTYSQDVSSLVHKSPLGMVTQRVGGLPLTLTYFLSPYNLIKAQSSNISTMLEKIADANLGLSCTVGIESAGNYQLPITPLLSVTRNSEGESVPAFSQLSPVNSASLPATFVLKMREPLVLCLSFAQQIQSVTSVPVGTWDQPAYLFSSLVKSVCSSYKDLIGDEFQASKAYRVVLPDQHHSYYVTESEEPALKCCSISSISFNHPSHVPLILSILRRQAVLNTLLSSCIRPKSQADSSPSVTFEISTITLDRMSVSFEHPLLEEMCCAEIDISQDPSRIHCSIYCAEEDGTISSEYSTKVLQRCLSIPVTMRAILRQMQSSNSRWGNGNSDHHGTFERRFQSHVNSDMDSHLTSSGQYGTQSYTSGNGNGGFDGSHSPRTHNVGDNSQQLNGMHHITPKESEGYGGEAEQVNDVTMVEVVEDGSGSANRSKAAYSSLTESWTPTSLAHTDVSLFNGMDSATNQSTGQPALMHRSSEIKNDSPGMETSVLEQLAAEIPPADDSNSQSEVMASLLSKGKESPSPKPSFSSVSITPVNPVQQTIVNSTYPNINMERRPGIEIIPFNKDPPGGLPNSLSITPVAGSNSNSKSSKSSKDKSSKYKDGRGFDSPDGKERNRDRDKERERKERKRRREEDKSPNSGGKPSKMLSLGSTLMGPPGSIPKIDGSPSRSHKSSSSSNSSSSGSTGSTHSSGSTPPASSGMSPLLSPSRSSSKSSTPSSSPKHPSSGGKPSMSALSMSALKSASSLMGSTSPSSKPKKSKDKDRERGSSDKERTRDRERSKSREKKSRTPTPTSNHQSSSRNPPLVKTKSLDFSLAVDEKSGDLKEDNTFNALLALAASSNSDGFSCHTDIPTSLNLNNQDNLSLSPTCTQDQENAKSGIGTSSGDNSGSSTTAGGGKSPLRSRKSSLSAVIDKLRLQHNTEPDLFQNGPKYANDAFSRKEQDGTFLEDFIDENDSPRNSKVNDVADVISFDQMNSGNNSPGDPFVQGLENLPCQSA